MKIFSSVLLDWYALHKRPLPWRNTQDPYKIWISEIILQQTRVAQGYDYFLRFISRFPDVQSLARASQDEVLKYWEGLGYYSRARHLHEAAQSMGGRFPYTYEGVRALKGVGDYTAAAICSFAYKMPYAVVDGNVQRVLARIFGIETPADSTEGKKQIAALAQKLLDKKRPDDYNQAIMDFGALQCVPASPDCAVCPYVRSCVAYQTGRVGQLPVRAAKTPQAKRFFSYIYVEQDGHTWLHRREGRDIWRGLYEPLLLETSSPLMAQGLQASPFWKGLFGRQKPQPLAGPVKHILSHRIIYAWFYRVSVSPTLLPPAGFIRTREKDLKKYAFPRLVQKVLDRMG